MDFLRGVYDLHVHAAPELFHRRGDAIEMAERAKAAGMAGLLLKAHQGSTVSIAALADRVVEGVRVYGSITLNRFVGGINPWAVAAALELGAKAVFMPTFHARGHLSDFGSSSYGLSALSLPPGFISPTDLGEGISILERGRLTSDAREIVRLAGAYGAFIGTSHLSEVEIEALVAECTDVGTKIVITHAFHVPRGSDEFYVSLAPDVTAIEIAANTVMPIARHQDHGASLARVRGLIEAVGESRIIISTDGGQPFNPWPADLLDAFLEELFAVGVGPAQLTAMTLDNPKALLNEVSSGS